MDDEIEFRLECHRCALRLKDIGTQNEDYRNFRFACGIFADWLEDRGRWQEAALTRAEWNIFQWMGSVLKTVPLAYEPYKCDCRAETWEVLLPVIRHWPSNVPAIVLTGRLLWFQDRSLLVGYRRHCLGQDIYRLYHRPHNPFKVEQGRSGHDRIIPWEVWQRSEYRSMSVEEFGDLFFRQQVFSCKSPSNRPTSSPASTA